MALDGQGAAAGAGGVVRLLLLAFLFLLALFLLLLLLALRFLLFLLLFLRFALGLLGLLFLGGLLLGLLVLLLLLRLGLFRSLRVRLGFGFCLLLLGLFAELFFQLLLGFRLSAGDLAGQLFRGKAQSLCVLGQLQGEVAELLQGQFLLLRRAPAPFRLLHRQPLLSGDRQDALIAAQKAGRARQLVKNKGFFAHRQAHRPVGDLCGLVAHHEVSRALGLGVQDALVQGDLGFSAVFLPHQEGGFVPKCKGQRLIGDGQRPLPLQGHRILRSEGLPLFQRKGQPATLHQRLAGDALGGQGQGWDLDGLAGGGLHRHRRRREPAPQAAHPIDAHGDACRHQQGGQDAQQAAQADLLLFFHPIPPFSRFRWSRRSRSHVLPASSTGSRANST